MQKQCKQCAGNAELSLLLMLSTVGISKRVQAGPPVILLCTDCLTACLHELRKSKLLSTNALLEAVNSALTAVQIALQERMKSESDSKARSATE